MCVNCDENIISEAFSALDAVFRQYGQRNVIDAIHNYYHHVQPKQGSLYFDEWQKEYGFYNDNKQGN